MATSWGAAGYKLQKDAGDEQRKLEKEAKKKGLWGSIGSTLGGLAAMALTGGMVNPLTVGLITAGASTAGGLLGAGTQKISGGKFHKGAREDIKDTITGDIVKSGLTSGLTAGAGVAAKSLTAAKTPVAGSASGSVGVKMPDLVDKASLPSTSLAEQSKSLFESTPTFKSPTFSHTNDDIFNSFKNVKI